MWVLMCMGMQICVSVCRVFRCVYESVVVCMGMVCIGCKCIYVGVCMGVLVCIGCTGSVWVCR